MMFRYMLAPLEDMSDNALRTLCYNHGADLTFTEMTRLSALVRNNKSTVEKIAIKSTTPTVIQLAALKETELRAFLDMYVPEKGFQGFNFNMGCPSPQFISLGMGCAQLKRIEKAKKLVALVQKKGYGCSIKLRLGANQYEKDHKAYMNLLNGVDADFFIVHARHGKEHYESPADNSVYGACVATGKEIIANGDITTKEQVADLRNTGVKGVMIGRAAVRNPAIFDLLKGKKTPTLEALKQGYLDLSIAYGEKEKYRNNVLKRLGKTLVTTNEKG